MKTENLRLEFQIAAIKCVYLRILDELGISEKEFLLMIAQSDAVQAAKSLLAPGKVQVGFRGLKRRGRRDLTVEHLVIQRQWTSLFTDGERKSARERLQRNLRKSRPRHGCELGKECPLHR